MLVIYITYFYIQNHIKSIVSKIIYYKYLNIKINKNSDFNKLNKKVVFVF